MKKMRLQEAIGRAIEALEDTKGQSDDGDITKDTEAIALLYDFAKLLTGYIDPKVVKELQLQRAIQQKR